MFAWYDQLGRPKWALSTKLYQQLWLGLGGVVNVSSIVVAILSIVEGRYSLLIFTVVYLSLLVWAGVYTIRDNTITKGAYLLWATLASFILLWLSVSQYYSYLGWLFFVYLVWLTYVAVLHIVMGFLNE